MDLTASVRERLKGLFPDLIGIELMEAAPERVSAILIVRDEICTTDKVLHGGAVMAFADTLGAVGTFVNLPPGARTTTIESETNFLGAAEGLRARRRRDAAPSRSPSAKSSTIGAAARRRAVARDAMGWSRPSPDRRDEPRCDGRRLPHR